MSVINGFEREAAMRQFGILTTTVAASATMALCACGEQMASDTTSGGSASAAPIAATAPGNVFVTMTEWRISLSSDTVAAGEVTFQISNRGRLNHQLEVEDGGEEVKSDTLLVGATRTLTARLEPGTYELYCPFHTDEGVHKELGMVDTLVVTGPSR
jgi:plastocyanin